MLKLNWSNYYLKLFFLFFFFSVFQNANSKDFKSDRIVINEIQKFSVEEKSTKFFRYKSSSEAKYNFYIQSGLHGNEHGAVSFSYWLMKRLENSQGKLSEINRYANIDFLPIANPDGFYAIDRYNKKNANLNRNFSVLFGKTREFPGSHEFSEPETRHIKNILSTNNYLSAVDIHGYINWIVGPSNPYILGDIENISERRLSKFREWDQSLKAISKQLTKYEFYTAGGLGDGGSFEDWAFWDQGIMAFCLEVLNPYKQENYAKVEKLFIDYENAIAAAFINAIKIHESIPVQDLADSNK